MRRFHNLVPLALAFNTVLGTPTGDNNGSSPTTGSGLEYAESCQARLFAWKSSKTSYGSKYGHHSTSLYSSEMTGVSYNNKPPTATSLITLCDGHPRVVGQWTTHNNSGTPYTTAWTNTNPVFITAPYPTPKPCSISPDDCKLLYSSWTSHWNSITSASPNYEEGLLSPPCESPEPPLPSYSTNAEGGQCDNCLIAGAKIRLMYWPVTTVAGSGDLCSEKAETVTGSATGPPRSIVTEGITITSPTVGVSIGGLSRVDGCGTTVDHTIIPVMPGDVSSVNGARALFTHKPFNFADLNYKCLGAPDDDFVTTGTRTDCYQEVPASAYFFGLANAGGANWYDPHAFTNKTIWPNYQPQVLPPQTITSAIRSLWGPDCYIHPDGIWDPPIALQQEASFPLPQITPGAPTQWYSPPTDAAQPGGATTPDVPGPTQPSAPTAEAQLDPSASDPTSSRPTAGSDQGWGQSEGSNGEDEHHDGEASRPTASNEHQGGAAGHAVIYTTVITYTSEAAGDGSEHTAVSADDDEHVYTTTKLSTATGSGHSDAVALSETAGSASSVDSSRSPASENSSSPSVSAGNGGVSNAIQSGIGGGDRNEEAHSQSNDATNVDVTSVVYVLLVAGATTLVF